MIDEGCPFLFILFFFHRYIPCFEGCNTPGSGGVPNPAISYTGAQPGPIAPGASKGITINDQWNGRIFNQNGRCGAKGEGCTMLEYNLGKSFAQRNSIGTFFSFWSIPRFYEAGPALHGCPFFRLTFINLSIPNSLQIPAILGLLRRTTSRTSKRSLNRSRLERTDVRARLARPLIAPARRRTPLE